MTKNSLPSTVVGITWYRPEQYSAVKAFCEDRDSMDPTYEVWKSGAEKVMRELQAQGTKVERVDFDLDEFKMWCSANAKPSNAASRSAFTSIKLRDAHSSDAHP